MAEKPKVESAPAPTAVASWTQKIKGEPWSKPEYRADDPLFQNRKGKIENLSAKSGRAAETDLLRYLDDRDKDLRSLAAYGLAQRGFGSVPALIKVLETGSKRAKGEAHKSLQRLARSDMGPAPKLWHKWWSDLQGL